MNPSLRTCEAHIFQALAKPTRIAIVEAVLKHYVSTHLNDTLSMLGEMAPEHDQRV